MAPAVAQEGALDDDFLIWRFAAERARQAADAARVRAAEAAVTERAERRGLWGLTPMLERAVRSLDPRGEPRRRTGERAAEPPRPAPTIVPRPVVLEEPRPRLRIAEAEPRAPIPEPVAALVRVAEPAAAPRPSEPAAPTTGAAVLPAVVARPPAVPLARAPSDGDAPAASLEEVLSRGATVPLGVALLIYDDVLEALQRLHASGAVHGGVVAATIAVDDRGRCSLRDGRAVAGLDPASSSHADVNAATALLVEVLASRASDGATAGATAAGHPTPLVVNALPVPARHLVEVTLQANGFGAPDAARLRQDLAVVAAAFLGDEWEAGARAWLAAAAYASCAAQRERDAEARADAGESRRALLLGGVKRRESRILIGLGIAASASVTLVVGAAVGITGSRTEAPQPATRVSITAPAPSVVPSLSAASPAAPAPAATPTPAGTPAPAPPPAAPARAAPTSAPTSFQPVAVPPVLPTLPPPSPAPTPSQCLLPGIVC